MVEILDWLKDVRQHGKVSRRRESLRQPGQGVDYSDEQYRGAVDRAIERLHPTRMRLRVTEIQQETASTKTFRFERTDGDLPPFRAGQYVNLFVQIGGVRTSRPYSIASAPGAGHLELTVRDKPDGFVAPYLLSQLQVGHELQSTGPAGSFYHEPLIDGDDLVFLAGGSGITPFAALARDAAARDLPLTMHLLYGSRVPEDVIFGDELRQLADDREPFDYSLVISEPPDGYDGLTGFLDDARIRDAVGEVDGKTFYLCGPNVMLGFCLDALAELGVPGHRIRRELYGPPDDPTADPAWPEGVGPADEFQVQLGDGRAIPARAGEPLICSLERHSIVLPAVCRSGECSYCRTRLLSGQVFMPAHTGLRESDRRFGFIHPCVAYPLEDLTIALP